MNLLYTVIIGFFVGLFARALMPGKDMLGFIMTTLLGIGGAIIGKFIGQEVGLYHDQQAAGFFMSLFGAMILLFLYNFVRRKNTGN